MMSSSEEEEEEAKEEASNVTTQQSMQKHVQTTDSRSIIDKKPQQEEEAVESELTNLVKPNSDEFLTAVDSPIYPMFISSVLQDESDMDPITREQLYNGMTQSHEGFFTIKILFSLEEDDPEYIFNEFDEFCHEENEEDDYEFRSDRATEIPRWELKALEEDFVDVDDSTLANVPVMSRPQSKQAYIELNCRAQKHHPLPPKPVDKTGQEEGGGQSILQKQQKLPTDGPILVDGSCSLLTQPEHLVFTQEELLALKVQMEKVEQNIVSIM